LKFLLFFALIGICGVSAGQSKSYSSTKSPLVQDAQANIATVYAEIDMLCGSNKYWDMSVDERAKAVLELLADLTERGFIKEGTIFYDESSYVISYEHSSGLISSEKLVEFNPAHN